MFEISECLPYHSHGKITNNNHTEMSNGNVNVYGKIGQASMSGLHNVVYEGLTFSYSRTLMPMSLQKVYMSMSLQKV